MKRELKTSLLSPLLDVVRKGTVYCRKQRTLARRIFHLWHYAGDNVECPFCRKSFARFRPTGALDRPFWKSPEGHSILELSYINVANAMCPWCGSSERHRALYFYLRDRLNFQQLKNITLLDISPDGFFKKEFFSRGDLHYVSLDIRPDRQSSVIMDLTAMGFVDWSLDGIICCHVLEHIQDDIQAIKEMYRALKHGGWAIIQVPIWADKTIEDPSVPPEKYLTLYGHKDHVRRCGPDYKSRLEAAGFRVSEDDFIGRLSKDKIQRYGLFDTEIIWFCEKA